MELDKDLEEELDWIQPLIDLDGNLHKRAIDKIVVISAGIFASISYRI